MLGRCISRFSIERRELRSEEIPIGRSFTKLSTLPGVEGGMEDICEEIGTFSRHRNDFQIGPG